jgi:hypothetical protein
MDLQQLIQPVIQEEDLQIKTPSRHVLIEIVQIRIVINILKLRYPTIVLAQHLRERSLSGANIARNGDVFCLLILGHS